jgi:DNA gyrase subunit A
VHWLKVHAIPETGPASKGKAIVNLLNLEPTERVATTVAVRDFPEDRYLIFATANGTIKKTELAAYANPRSGGIIGINVDEGDHLLAVRVTDGKKDILMATAKGYAIRFPESDVRSMGRAAYGVRGMSLRPGDRVVAMEALDPEGEVLSVAARGYGKRTPLDFYRRQSRGGLGIINLKVSDKTGEVVGAYHVLPGDGLMLITQEGMIIRITVAGVRVVGRSTQGVKLMDLTEEDRLVAVAKLAEREEPAEGGDGTDGGSGLRPAAGPLGDLEPEDVQEGPDLAVELAESAVPEDEPEGEGRAADHDAGADEPVN